MALAVAAAELVFRLFASPGFVPVPRIAADSFGAPEMTHRQIEEGVATAHFTKSGARLTGNPPQPPTTMRLRLLITALCAAGVSLAPSGLSAQGCAPSWSYSEAFRDRIVSIVTATDSGSARVRQAYSLPAVASAAVVFQTDSAVCAQAIAAFSAEVARYGGTPGSVWVLKVGPTRYIVFDHKQKTGEFYDHMVFDENFVYKVTITSG